MSNEVTFKNAASQSIVTLNTSEVTSSELLVTSSSYEVMKGISLGQGNSGCYL